MKNIVYISLILLLFTACKPTSNIVTSKEVAVKKGLYTEPKNLAVSEMKSAEKKKKNQNKDITQKQNTSKKTGGVNHKNDEDIVIESEDASYLIKQLINSASDNLGVNYRPGGTTKSGFDCSGLVYSTFKKFDITLPRSSHEMATVGTKVDLSDAKKGDLIFFINRGRRINHVGMVVEVSHDEVKFIHSSTQSGVIISSTKEPYYNRTFVQINRVLM
ncbi:C40 family peptidase [Flavobacterium sp. 102]|uniref:C40 family peptidase n=1 Tax=Flavobacterium sp. 102 TaxID=2135623 RepID=UPI000F18B204|nr:C40 family peptidase [Flavobacterium sp. 102]RKS01519.1 NlpC/P60 family protein [Flavobacterium sp. 102]